MCRHHYLKRNSGVRHQDEAYVSFGTLYTTQIIFAFSGNEAIEDWMSVVLLTLLWDCQQERNFNFSSRCIDRSCPRSLKSIE